MWIIFVLVSGVYNAFVSVHCCLAVTCWERADTLALVCDVYCICYFPLWYPGSGVVLDLSFPDRCCLSYFVNRSLWSPAGKGLTHWLLFVMFIVCFTFPCGIRGQMWHLMVSFPDICCLSYFVNRSLVQYASTANRKSEHK